MMYALDFYCDDNTTHDTLWFEDKAEALKAAHEMDLDGVRVIVTETDGSIDDEGKVILDL